MNTEMINYTMTAMNVAQHDWTSLYMKMWAEGVIVDGREVKNTEDLKWLIEDVLYMGNVARIDVKKSRNKNGAIVRSAFIHFHMWDSNYGKFVRDSINHKGKYVVNMSNKTQEPFQNTNYNGNPYFAFYKNINPIQESSNEEMNKEQLVARCVNLEKALEEKTQEVTNFINNERSKLINTIENMRKELQCYQPYAPSEYANNFAQYN
jgi:hypothetical protein